MIKNFFSKQNVFFIVLSIFIASFLVPVLIGCFYAVPSADDFSNTLGYQAYAGSHLRYPFHYVKQIWHNWQGTYTGCFLVGIPVYYLGGIKALRAFLVFNYLFFLASSAIFVRNAIIWLDYKKEKSAVIAVGFFAMAMFWIMKGNLLNELFYWYTGACVYTVPLSFMLLCVSCFMFYERKKSVIVLILGCGLAFAAAGGSLDIAALLCALLLFGLLYNLINLRMLKLNSLMGIVALIGALINTCAPGNFLRHGVIDETGVHPLEIILKLLPSVTDALIDEIESGYLLVIIAIAFFVTYHYHQKVDIKLKYPGLVTLYAYFGIFITEFPVCLGVSGVGFEIRTAFINRIAIMIFVILCAAYWGAWCAQRECFKFSREAYVCITLICVIPFLGSCKFAILQECTPYKMIYYLGKGDFAYVAEREMGLLEQIKESDELDVMVYSPGEGDAEWTNLKIVGITDDEENWINDVVAQYYGVNTVKVVIKEN